jgi:hypothetical protein
MLSCCTLLQSDISVPIVKSDRAVQGASVDEIQHSMVQGALDSGSIDSVALCDDVAFLVMPATPDIQPLAHDGLQLFPAHNLDKEDGYLSGSESDSVCSPCPAVLPQAGCAGCAWGLGAGPCAQCTLHKHMSCALSIRRSLRLAARTRKCILMQDGCRGSQLGNASAAIGNLVVSLRSALPLL